MPKAKLIMWALSSGALRESKLLPHQPLDSRHRPFGLKKPLT